MNDLSGQFPDRTTEEDHLSQVLEQTIDAVVEIDASNTVTRFNSAAEALWGYGRDEVLGRNVKMLVPHEMQAHHDDWVDAHRAGGRDKIVGTSREVPVHRKDRSIVWASLSLSKIVLDGAGATYVAFLKDVTAERAAREMMNATLEQTIDSVVMLDDSNHITFFNAAAERLWGYARKEVVGKNVKMLVPPEMRSSHDSWVNAHRAGGEDKIVGTSREVPIHRKDGSVGYGSLSLSCVKVDDGAALYTAFVKDTTEEVMRREQFRLLSLVANETDNSVVISDSQGRIVYVNPGFEKLTGYSAAEAKGRKPGSLLQGEHTDPEAVQRISAKLKARAAFYEEILNYSKAGEPYWISLAINPVFDERGELEYFVSVQANVTSTRQESMDFDAMLRAISAATGIAEWSSKGQTIGSNSYIEARCSRIPELSQVLSPTEIMNVVKGSTLTKSLSMPGSDGQEVWFDAVFSATTAIDGTTDRIIMCAADATRRFEATLRSSDAMVGMLKSIANLVNTIGRVAQQTNLLSINASIEAARAGESGKGFGVVATEIRSLAAQVDEASKEIEALVEKGRDSVEELKAHSDV